MINIQPSAFAFSAIRPAQTLLLGFAAPAQRVRLLLGAIITIAMAAGFIAAGPQFLNDPDTLWHITVGKDIWQTKDFPHIDAYSHSFAGAPWIAKEWLSQIILYTAYSAGGWNGVVLLTVTILLVVLWQVYWSLSAQLKPVIAGAIAVGCLSMSGDVLVARPHIIVLPFIVLFVQKAWSAAQEKRAPSFWLLGVMCLWANLHASFTFGFVAAFLAFLSYLLETRDLKSGRTVRWIVFLALCPIASIIHPYGFEAIWSTLSVAESEALPYIQEWRAFSASEDFKVEAVMLGLLAALLASRFRTNIGTALFICLLIHLYFTHTRFVYLLFMLTPLLVARDIALQFPALSFRQWARTVETSSMERGLARAASIGVPVAAAALIGGALFIQGAARWTPPATSYPINAINAARTYGVEGNVLNEYAFGGALIFEGAPTFLDGRADRLFQGGFMHDIEKSMNIDGGGILRKQIDDYGIGWSIMRPADGRAALLDNIPGWSRIYEDEFAVVHAASDLAP